MKNLRINQDQKGFTLIELMIVIAIIGILAAIAIPNFVSYRDKAFCSAAESDVNSIMSGLADYFAIPSNTSFANVAGVATVDFTGSNSLPLSGQNLGSITSAATATGNTFTVRVVDGSARCPQNYTDEVPGWNTAGRYFEKIM